MFTIYKLTFSNGKSYIGMTKNLNKRLASYRRAAKRYTSDTNYYCQSGMAWAEFGAPIIEVLTFATSREEALQQETRAILAHETLVPNGFNTRVTALYAPFIR